MKKVPFQALLDWRGTYVAEQAAIVYAPSIAAWMEMSHSPNAAASAAATGARRDLLEFGNPTTPSAAGVMEGTRGTLAPLPEAETDRTAIPSTGRASSSSATLCEEGE